MSKSKRTLSSSVRDPFYPESTPEALMYDSRSGFITEFPDAARDVLISLVTHDFVEAKVTAFDARVATFFNDATLVEANKGVTNASQLVMVLNAMVENQGKRNILISERKIGQRTEVARVVRFALIAESWSSQEAERHERDGSFGFCPTLGIYVLEVTRTFTVDYSSVEGKVVP